MDYDTIRSKFRYNLIKQAVFCQQDLLYTDPNYHEIKERNLKREILKCVDNFVKDTKRFKKEKFGF